MTSCWHLSETSLLLVVSPSLASAAIGRSYWSSFPWAWSKWGETSLGTQEDLSYDWLVQGCLSGWVLAPALLYGGHLIGSAGFKEKSSKVLVDLPNIKENKVGED